MTEPRYEASAQGAVTLMTAWLAAPDGPPTLLLQALERHIEEHPSGDRLNGAAELIMGLTNLCGSLLVLRELETGLPCHRTMQELAHEIVEAHGSRETADD